MHIYVTLGMEFLGLHDTPHSLHLGEYDAQQRIEHAENFHNDEQRDHKNGKGHHHGAQYP